ncbi:MAG: hypothetical protein IKK25_08470 [Lentisphaeria bacterium]|nr:hypothetical protein [Lentisphaeria bacterium]
MKILIIAGKVLAWILALVAALLVVLNVGVTWIYSDFFGDADAAFRIPGLNTGFVPQGIHYLQEQDTWLVSGYMKDHSSARIYIRDADGNTRFVELMNGDGSAYDEHAGGVTVNGDYVYLPGTVGVDVFRLTDIMAGQTAKSIGKIAMEYDGDCCTFYNGYLFVGDFYYPEAYKTPEEHRVTTPAGDENKAVIAVYKADPAAEFGIDPRPVAAISIHDRVQGIGFTEDGQIVLSTSYGFNDSQLWFYDSDEARQGRVELMGNDVPLYYLDSVNLTHCVAMPPMSEEVVCKDGKVYVLFESACTKYLYGNLIRGTHVYAYEKET